MIWRFSVAHGRRKMLVLAVGGIARQEAERENHEPTQTTLLSLRGRPICPQSICPEPALRNP